MSAPSPLRIPLSRGRGVARRRGFRVKPLRRGPDALEEEAAGPEHVYVIPNTWRPMPPGEPDLARAASIEKLLADPTGARRDLLEARLAYWRARMEKLQARLELASEAFADALLPGTPAAVPFNAEARYGAAWADVRAAKAELRRIEAELADA